MQAAFRKKLDTSGNKGSEGGVILSDEEYGSACRITLERCERFYAVTCGISGLMVHTAFSDAEHCRDMYESMKKDLQEFFGRDTTEDEDIAFCEYFAAKY